MVSHTWLYRANESVQPISRSWKGCNGQLEELWELEKIHKWFLLIFHFLLPFLLNLKKKKKKLFSELYIWTMLISKCILFQTLQRRQLNYFSQPGNSLLENRWWLRNYQKWSGKWKFKSLPVLLTAMTYLTSKQKVTDQARVYFTPRNSFLFLFLNLFSKANVLLWSHFQILVY